MNKRFLVFCLVIAFLLAAVGAVPAAQAQADKVRIALITPSARNDLAWSQSIYDAVIKVQEELGGPDAVEVAVSENLFRVPDAAAAMRDYASQGYDLVISHGTQYGATMFEVAAEFPEISFAWGNSTDFGEEQGLTNVFAYEVRAEEGGYVNGVMAALLTKSGVIGVVGPVNAGDAKLYIDGFTAGAKATRPDADVKVIFTDSFGDTARATEAAKTLISQGADVLTGTAQQVPGAISEIQKANGYWFGTQSNQAEGWPDTVVCAQVFDWSGVIKEIIEARAAGTLGGKFFEISLKSGLSMVFNDQVEIPDEVREAAEETIQKIIDGEIKVPGNPAHEMEMEPTPEATQPG